MIDNLRPLTQEQRQAAHEAARQAVVRSIGPRPAREQFAHHTISKYPPSVTRLISLLCIILLSLAPPRNAQVVRKIRTRHSIGESISMLTRIFGINEQHILQIPHERRK